MVHRELKRKGGTLFLLGQEDKSTPPAGFQDSRCWQGYRAWTGTLDLALLTMRRAAAIAVEALKKSLLPPRQVRLLAAFKASRGLSSR